MKPKTNQILKQLNESWVESGTDSIQLSGPSEEKFKTIGYKSWFEIMDMVYGPNPKYSNYYIPTSDYLYDFLKPLESSELQQLAEVLGEEDRFIIATNQFSTKDLRYPKYSAIVGRKRSEDSWEVMVEEIDCDEMCAAVLTEKAV